MKSMKVIKEEIDRSPLLCRAFVHQAKEFLSQYPQVKHEWSIDDDEDHCILDIPEECESGFPVTIEVYPDEIMVIGSGAHKNFHLDGNPDELVDEALGLVYDLLSPAMRIREYLAGGEPHKWAFEVSQDGQWMTEEIVGLLFWKYFGRRSEKIYQNQVLPARDNPVE